MTANDTILKDFFKKEVFDNFPDIILLIKLNGEILYTNSVVSKYGFKKTDLIGKSFFNFISSKSILKFKNQLLELAKGKPVDGIIIIKTSTGNSSFGYRISPVKKKGKIVFLQTILRDITIREKLVSDLSREKENAEKYLNLTGSIIMSLDKKGDIVLLNKKGYEALGYKEGSLFGKNWFETFISKKDLPEIKGVFNKIIAGKIKFVTSNENDVITKDGSIRTIRWFNSFIKDNNGNIVGALSSGEDITKTKEFEKELLKLKKGIESANEVIFITTHDGLITYVNPAFQKIYGYKQKEVIGKNPRFLKSGLIPEEGYKQFWKTITSRKVYVGQIVNKTKSGKFVTMQGSVNPISDAKNNLIGFLAIQADITESKKEHEALRASEERFKTIVEHSDNMFYIHDTNHNLTYISPQSKKIFGYSPNEMLVKWTSLTSNNPINKIGYKLTNESLKTGKVQQPYILELRKKNGSLFLAEVDESPIRNSKGEIIGMAGAIRDVSKKEKDKEEEKMKSDQLIQFNKMAVGRELKMIELKNKIRKLEEKVSARNFK